MTPWNERVTNILAVVGFFSVVVTVILFFMVLVGHPAFAKVRKADKHQTADGVYTIGVAEGTEGQYIVDTRFDICFFSRGERFVQIKAHDCVKLLESVKK